MDDVFRALADASRRRLLDRLRVRDGQTLRELCAGLAMSRQAVSKHLTVLETAGLVTSERRGREKLHHLNPVPIQELSDRWIGKYRPGRSAPGGRRGAHRPAQEHEHEHEHEEEVAVAEPEFEYAIYIQTTPERLYAALTDAEFAQRYFGGWGPMSVWRVGSPVLWKMGPDGGYEDLDQVVLAAEPGRRLAYTWHRILSMHRQLFDSEEEFERARAEQSRVAFDIEPARPASLGVKLTLTHDGFDSPDSEMLKGVSGGWVMILSTLKTLLEREGDGTA
ncbi:metalloregulator ArsR/SmtB family transcription factor [Streptomyces sp. NBC_00083]|uniref:ArsR/SmtB family transcription factor n=1 Tax=Streptomyces sp. NBC_00083 TaxID=2975647 RepID=UPI00224ED9F7|nr:metalloregulator ArsR/SmtB family transcription factor [Streptomyces sp. NBC_00083]MCX5386421.1 metalloregulator ArsR/SmtB family transcription factor [Streptomyces sp. NBC_00083]